VATNIRVAGPEDASAVVRLIADVAAENMWTRTELPFDSAERVQRTAAAMKIGDMVAFVAQSGSEIVGEVTLVFRDDHAALAMVVAAPYRRQGLGRALMLSAINKARERAASRIDLAVFSHNVAAITLFRSLDFVESGSPMTWPRSDGQRWERIPMSKYLHGTP